jgi:hypothetical protein
MGATARRALARQDLAKPETALQASLFAGPIKEGREGAMKRGSLVLACLLLALTGCQQAFLQRFDQFNERLEKIQGELERANAKLVVATDKLEKMERHMEQANKHLERFLKRLGGFEENPQGLPREESRRGADEACLSPLPLWFLSGGLDPVAQPKVSTGRDADCGGQSEQKQGGSG